MRSYDGRQTISGYSYKCSESNRIFTFNSEDKYNIHLKFHRKKCKICNEKKDKYYEKNIELFNEKKYVANTNELSKLLRIV